MSEIIGYNDRVILDQYGASIGGGDGSRSSRPTCSADPFQKWKWMMDYCRERKWHPSDFWGLAEKAWREKFEPND